MRKRPVSGQIDLGGPGFGQNEYAIILSKKSVPVGKNLLDLSYIAAHRTTNNQHLAGFPIFSRYQMPVLVPRFGPPAKLISDLSSVFIWSTYGSVRLEDSCPKFILVPDSPYILPPSKVVMLCEVSFNVGGAVANF